MLKVSTETGEDQLLKGSLKALHVLSGSALALTETLL